MVSVQAATARALGPGRIWPKSGVLGRHHHPRSFLPDVYAADAVLDDDKDGQPREDRKACLQAKGCTTKVQSASVESVSCTNAAAENDLQYLEPILAATWDEDGAVHDVCRALQPRFREPNAIVCALHPRSALS
jgi:hypothetical protein